MSSADSSVRRKNRRFMIIALAVAAGAFALLTMSGIGENLVYYWGPADVRKAGEKAYGVSIRLGGFVKPGSVAWDRSSSDLRFVVLDRDMKTAIPVHTTGIPPQMFREGIGVVVEGTMTRTGTFEGTRLLVSHDNEYRSPEDHTKVDTRELIESTRGIDNGSRSN